MRKRKKLNFNTNTIEIVHNLYETYYIELKLYGIAIFKDDILVEDALHDIFIKLLRMDSKKLHRIQNYDHYLKRCLRNNYKEYFKKRKGIKILSYDSNKDVRICEPSIIDEIDNQAAKEYVEDKLSPKEWKVLIHRYENGLKDKEIEALLGLKEKSVARIIFRSKIKISNFNI